MRIILFIDKLTDGGAERQLSILANLLSERGHQITVATYSPAGDFYCLSNEIKRVRLGDSKNKLLRYFNMFCFFMFTKYDAVICYMIGNTKHFVRSTVLRRKNYKLISSERSITTVDKWESEKTEMARYYRYSDFIVPNSYTQGDNLRKMFPFWEHKIRVITNYTEIDKIAPSPLPLKPCREVGIFARYAEPKNCLRFCEMLKVVVAKTNVLFHVNWFGNKYLNTYREENNWYLRMNHFVKENNLENYITLNSTVNIATVMDKIDIICLPSIAEGFSNAISEGICYGKPMIVSNVSDNSIMVKNGINGFLFDPLDINNMVNTFILMIESSDEQLREMGVQSRRIAEALFNKDTFVNNYLELC